VRAARIKAMPGRKQSDTTRPNANAIDMGQRRAPHPLYGNRSGARAGVTSKSRVPAITI